MADVVSFFISGKIFGWLPVRDIFTLVFLVGSLALLLDAERTRRSGKLTIWIAVVSLWTIAIILDSFRRIEGLAILHPIQRVVEFAAIVTVVRAAYSASQAAGRVQHGL